MVTVRIPTPLRTLTGGEEQVQASGSTVKDVIETLEKNKADLVTVQPALREFSAGKLYKAYDIPYHPGALKYFKDHNMKPAALN